MFSTNYFNSFTHVRRSRACKSQEPRRQDILSFYTSVFMVLRHGMLGNPVDHLAVKIPKISDFEVKKPLFNVISERERTRLITHFKTTNYASLMFQ